MFFKIKPLGSGTVIYAGSKLDYLGFVFINADMEEHPWYFLVDKLVHEVTHQVLISIMLEEEVVLNPDRERYKSPLRTKGCTLWGYTMAAFVIYRIVVVFHYLLGHPIYPIVIAKGSGTHFQTVSSNSMRPMRS